MTDNGTTGADEIHEQGTEEERVNLAEEFASLGRKFGEALRETWDSDERARIENELTRGIRRFGEEIDKGTKKAREGETAKRVEESVDKIQHSETAQKFREGMISALRGLSETLGDLAEGIDKDKDDDTPAE